MSEELEAQKKELELQKAHVEGQRVGYKWMMSHMHDFDQSEESSRKIGEYLKTHQLVFSEENLEKAFTDLTAQGVKFTAEVAPVVPVEEPLPEAPFCPKVNTIRDIRKLSSEEYRKAILGPNGREFKARVNEILRRGK